VHGILNLASLGQAVEIRVAIQRHTIPVLAGLATFITRNLPFISQVALMGLEMTGLARPNSAEVWAEPADYQSELAEAVRSISDWKNDYRDICQSCSVRDTCGGGFTTSGNRLSQHLHAVL
jgi:hypothetical protein